MKVLVVALMLVIGCCVLFATTDIDDLKSSNSNDDKDSVEKKDSFAASDNLFRNVSDVLIDTNLGNVWRGVAENYREVRNKNFTGLLNRVVDANQQVDSEIKSEADQVNEGRGTLGNILATVQLAIPVAESLWSSGPAGPALSNNFQLAVAHSSIGTASDTTNGMHEKSAAHARHLMALASVYDQTFSAMSSEESAVATNGTVG